MLIQPVDVTRDNLGCFFHPDLPTFSKENQLKQLSDWAVENNLSVIIEEMNESADVDFLEQYYSCDNGDLSRWEPVKPRADAFLLAIFEGVDGPIAWFAILNKELNHE